MRKDEPRRLPPAAYTLEVQGIRLRLLGTVFGLASEGERTRAMLDEEEPDRVALGVPPEDLAGLARLSERGDAGKPRPPVKEPPVFAADAIAAPGLEGILGAAGGKPPTWARPTQPAGPEDDEEFYTTKDTRVFLQLLGSHGDVDVPPRELVAAHAWAQAQGRPLDALDLSDDAHSDLFVRSVSMFQIMRQNRRLKRLYETGVEADGARDFAIAWDAQVNSGSGFLEVERAREAHMAERLASIAHELAARASAGGHAQRGRVVAVVPFERAEGVARYLVERKGARLEATADP